MTQAIEYRVDEIEREEWGSGPWTEEPDKVQWVDEATGLDCLIVRNSMGALCGYVGVPESHSLYGVDYGQCPKREACDADVFCDHRPDSRFSVHGGLTFADACTEATRERWEKWRESMIARKPEAAKYPKGDSARAWRTLGKYMDDYDAWAKYAEARFVCHVPLPGRPAKVWWFGFDCAHAGDLTPGLQHAYTAYGPEIYRTREYVAEQCASLARQLKEVA